MFKIQVLLSLLFLVLIANAQTSSQNTFCLQTFNGYGPIYAPRVSERTEKFTQEMKSQGCAVIQLQEIWNHSQIQIVKDNLGQNYQIYSPNETNRFGLMSLSKVKTLSTEFHIFEFNSDGGLLDGGRELAGVEKGFAVQTLSLYSGHPVSFINLHLHPASQAVRLAQIYELIKWSLARESQDPLVLSGDFNMAPGSLEYRFLTESLRLQDSVLQKWGQYPLHFCTYCSVNPLGWLSDDRIFDYVFYSKSAPLKPANVQVDMKGLKDAPYSDHYGLRVDFSYFPQASDEGSTAQEQAQLVEDLTAVMKVIAQQYTPASRIYNELGWWRQELSQNHSVALHQ